MSDRKAPLPYDLPTDHRMYAETVRRRARHIRRKYGECVSATRLIQELVLRAIEKAPEEHDRPRRGFWRAVHWLVIDQYRRDRRRDKYFETRRAAAVPQPEPEQEAIGGELMGAIDRVVSGFGPADRDIWERLSGGEKYPQIAAAMGTTVDAVKMKASRLRRRVQDALPAVYGRGGAGNV